MTASPPSSALLLRPLFVRWALGVGFALLIFHAARSGFDHDEIEHLHAAWLVSQGQKPFQDFMEQHHPTLFYLLAPLASLLEGSPRGLVFAGRVLNLALLAALLAILGAVVRPLLRDGWAAWPSLLLLGCFVFVRNSMEVRPDPWMNLMCFAGFWQWVRYLRSPGRLLHAALAGLCFGAAFAFLPKALYFVGLVGLGTALALHGREAWVRALRGAAVAIGTALIPAGVFALALWRGGLWDDFVFWNYTFNRFHYLETRLGGVSPMETLMDSFTEDPLLWLGGVFGVGLAARSVWRREAVPEVTIAAAVTVGFVLAMFRTRWPFSHNLLLMQPLLALLTAVVLERLRAPALRAVAGGLLVLMVVKVCILCSVYTEGKGADVVQRRLLTATEPSTPLAVSPPDNPIFRPNAFFFWYIPEGFARSYLEWCRLHGEVPWRVDADRRVWQQRPPAYVYVPKGEPTWVPFEFSLHRDAYVETDLPGLYRLAQPASSQLELRRPE